MKPIYLDFHIHTSPNPETPNESYNLVSLREGIEKTAGGKDYLVSLTDHNFINKKAYLEAVRTFANILLGVELHIRNYDDAPPYHCHILFKVELISEAVIDEINLVLDRLFPKKVIGNSDKVPRLEDIMNAFDKYEFLLLPHGGQNHSTFDKSIPKGVVFDKTLERSIYYNHFDGFTARSNSSIDNTQAYFKKLGIVEFVHLVTATDNYEPTKYPNCKAGMDASEFTPTWMLSRPTFDGLRLSLSEASRLIYGKKPDTWSEWITHATLQNEHIDIDVKLSPGLNVVIGGSSSGKSLFVDSMFRKIIGDFGESVYSSTLYAVDKIVVTNPTGQHPHYLDQNYISRVCDPKDKENKISDISILRNVFPSDSDERESIANGLLELNKQLGVLVQSVKDISSLNEELNHIPSISRLIVTDKIHANPLKLINPSPGDIASTTYSKASYDSNIKMLDEIETFLGNNPLVQHDETLVKRLKGELTVAFENGQIEREIRKVIEDSIKVIDEEQAKVSRETTTKRKQFEQVLESIKKYQKASASFYSALEKISTFKIKVATKKIESMGHSLFIENDFELTKEKFLETVNNLLKPTNEISKFEDISPERLFETNFKKKNPKVADYDDFSLRINQRFSEMNKKNYRIITKEGAPFESLSAGWKTSVILDLILGWDSDTAPLIIDQPEDNLATNYINHGLLVAIKRCKSRKQVILVSHNATIPMLGDAQNIILCKNENGKITIRSDALEGSIENTSVVDHIVKITDGGKASVKKRVKKYNLKNYRESE